MNTKLFFLLMLLVLLVLVACVPSGPMQPDLYSSAQSSRATADSAMQLAQFQEQFLTATAQAPIVHITETAAAVIVQDTQAAATSQAGMITQTASWVQTAQWWTPTPNATSTAAFAQLMAEQTQIANNIERDKLELERQRDRNDFMGKAPVYSFVVVVLVLTIFIMLIVRRWRFQPAKIDERGNVIPLLDIVEGTATDIDRNPNFRGQLAEYSLRGLMFEVMRKKMGLPPQLPAITADRQDATTQRDQLLDLASRGLPGMNNQAPQKKLAAQEMTKLLTGPTLESRFKIVNDPNQLEVIDGEVIQVLDNEWQEGAKK